MEELLEKQKQFLNKDELNTFNMFNNSSLLNTKKPKINTNINIIEDDFLAKLTLLKSKKHSLKLYKKLIKIYNFVNLDQAKKYLNGFLEFEGYTLNEYLRLEDK